MVAIFTGAGTGAERSSGNTLGLAGLLGSGSIGRSGQQVMLNAANGNLLISQRDEFLVGRGPDAVINRTYNSHGDASDDNGDNWRQSTQRGVRDLVGAANTAGSTVRRMSGDGSLITYSWNGSAYVATDGAGSYDTLTYDGTWRWTDGDSRVVEVYGGPGNQISQMIDTSGAAISYAYSGNQLTDITTSNGESIHYAWSGANLVQVQANTTSGFLTRTRYEYDGYDRLTSVITDLTPTDSYVGDGATYTTSYTYHGTSKLVATITEINGTRLEIGYDGSNRVNSLGQTVTGGTTRTTTIGYGSGATVITDPHGQATTLNYDGAGQLSSIVTPPPGAGQQAQTVSFGYNGNGDLISSTTAAGTTTYQYDGNGNVLYVGTPQGNDTWRTYNSANQMLLEMHSGADQTGDNVYHSTRYVYDGQQRLQFTIDAEGGVVEYGIGWYGRTEWTRTFVAGSYDVSGLAWNTPIDHQSMLNWSVTSDKTGAMYVGYGFDDRFNITQKVSYGRSDAAGNLSVADGYTHEFLTYDQAGQLLSRTTAGLNAETFVYDGLGRLKASTDSGGATTSIVFNDAAMQTVVTLASGLVRTSTYNRAGELVATSKGGAYMVGGTTSYEYDALGRMRKATDPNGESSYVVYDKVGRKVAEVNHWGWMTEYRYDAADRLVATVRYASVPDAGQLAQVFNPAASPDIAAIRPAAHSYDIWQWTVYDAAGRVVENIQGDGAVMRFEHDGSDRLVRTTQFADRLSQAQLDGFKASAPNSLILPVASGSDSIARTFYDRAGHVVGTLDGEGWLSRITYDKAGRVVDETAFYNATDPNLRAGGSFNALVASVGTHAQDAVTRKVYDGQGHLRFSIDGLNRVTEYGYQYDTPTWNWQWSAYGAQRSTTRFAGTIPALGSYTMDSVRQALANAGLVGNAANRTSYAVYDNYNYNGGAGRLMYSVEADGSVTGYAYDVSGRMTRKTRYSDLRPSSYLPSGGEMDAWAGSANGNPDNRVERYFYNARGELRFSIDAEGYVTRNDYDAAGQLAFSAIWSNAVAAHDGWTIDTVAASQSGDWAGTSYSYNPDGQLTRATDGIGNIHDYQYYATGKLCWDIVSNGQGDESRTLHVYDASGQLTARYVALGTAEQAMTGFGYDGRGNVVSVTDANNHTTTRSYDRANQLVSETNAVGATTSYQYDALGNRVRTTDARGFFTYDYYDKLGRLAVTRDAEDYATEYGYTVFGDLAYTKRLAEKVTSAPGAAIWPAYVTSAADATTSFEYDKLGRLVRTTDAEGYSEYKQYNAFGDVNRITNKIGGITDFIYYRRGQLHYEYVHSDVYDSNGNQTSGGYYKTLYQYDWRGNVSATYEGYASPAQRITTFAYDKSDRLIQKTVNAQPIVDAGNFVSLSSVSAVETYAYDMRGNLTQVTDANGQRTLFYYDDQNRRIAEVSAVGTLSELFYDAVGNVMRSRVWGSAIGLPGVPGGTPPAAPGGECRDTVYGYDNINRLLTSSVENVRTGRWNGSSLALVMQTITTSYEYDSMGNIVTVTDGNGTETHHLYDRAGRKVRTVDGEGYFTGWLYDAQGNVWHERRWAIRSNFYTGGLWQDPPLSGEDRCTNFAYDRNGRRIAEYRFDVEAYGVDGSGTLYANNGTSTISYYYNGLGEVTGKTEATGEQTLYQYDSNGRLVAEARAGYVDADGNFVQPQLFYRYDALGNLVYTRQTGTGGGAERVTRYVYEAGRLSSMQDAAGAITYYYYDRVGNLLRQGGQRTRATDGGFHESVLFTRDAAGRVVSQTIGQWNGSSWNLGDRQNMQYNAYGELARRGTNGGWHEEFQYDATGQVVKSNAGDGVWRFFVHDGAGNRTMALESEGNWIGGLTLDQALAQATGNFTYWPGDAYVDGINLTINIYDRRNQQTHTYLPKRQLSETTGVRDLWSSRTYTAFGEVASETDARGATTNYYYNTMGRMQRAVRPQVLVTGENGTVSSVNPFDFYYYDRSGRTVAVRDANNNITRRGLLAGTGYGGKDALVAREWQADGGVTTNAYDRFGDLRRTTDAVGRATVMTYDAMGRVTQIVRPSGQYDVFGYDTLGQRVSHWTSLYGAGVLETTIYDQQGRVIAQTGLGGDTTTTAYYWEAGAGASGAGTTVGAWQRLTTYANARQDIDLTDTFGRMIASTDMGGRQTLYTYDLAGRLTARTGEGAMGYSWLNSGLLGALVRGYGDEIATQSDPGQSWSRERTSYSYTATGQKEREVHTSQGGSWQDYGYWDPYDHNYYPDYQYTTYGSTISDAAATYDALGRMTAWSQTGAMPTAIIDYQYDAAGNVRRSNAHYSMLDQNGNASVNQVQDYWYRYDAMNRVVTQKGEMYGGQIGRGLRGVDYAYDAAGQRVRATRTAGRSIQIHNPDYDPYGNPYDYPYTYNGMQESFPGQGGNPYVTAWYDAEVREDYGYAADGQLSTVRIAESEAYDNYDGTVTVTGPAATGALKANYEYDALGRVTHQVDWLGDGAYAAYDRQVSYNANGQATWEAVVQRQGVDTITSYTSTDYGYGAGYALGQAVSIATSSYRNGNYQSYATTTNTYTWYAGAATSQITHNDGQGHTYHTYYSYGSGGVLNSVYVADGRPHSIAFTNDMAGQALRRDESDNNYNAYTGGDPHEIWYRFDGRQLGYTGNNGTLDTDYQTSVASRTQTPGTGAFRNGQSYGGAYAEFDGQVTQITSYAQGSSGGSYTVRRGESLSSIAANLWGDAGLWYKLAGANGLGADSQLPAGQVLNVPSGVQRSSRTAGTFKPFDPSEVIGDTSPTSPQPQAASKKKNKCGVFGQILLIAVAVAVTIASHGALAGFASSSLGLGATGSAIVGGALAGMAGSVVSQSFGVATGLQESFSWKGVALAGLSGAVGGALKGVDVFRGAGKFVTAANDFARGALSSVAVQGIAVATGLQSKFDFVGVAIGGVVGAVGGAVGRGIGLQDLKGNMSLANIGRHLTGGLAGAIAGAAAQSMLTGTDFGDNIMSVLPETIAYTIGNALGNAFHRAAAPPRGMVTTPAPSTSTTTTPAVAPCYGGGGVIGAMGMSSLQAIDWGKLLNGATFGIFDRNGDGRATVTEARETTSNAVEDIIVTGTRLANDAYAQVSQILSQQFTDRNIGRSVLGSLADRALPIGGRMLANHYLSDRNAAAFGGGLRSSVVGFVRSVISGGETALNLSPAGLTTVALENSGLRVPSALPNANRSFATAASTASSVGTAIAARASDPGMMLRDVKSVYASAERSVADFSRMDSAGKQEVIFSLGGRVTGEVVITAATGGIGRAATVGRVVTVEANVGRMGAAAESAAIRGPTGEFYSVAFETKLSPTSYPGVSRGAHFQEANGSLLQAMEGDAAFASDMQSLGINLQRTPTGLAPRTSPSGWTWHHAEEPGVMQLVPRSQHQPGSVFQGALHPDGKGGYSIWGK